MSLRSRSIGILLAFPVLLCPGAVLADQQEFELRTEQQLRPHDFDVKHYRIVLSLDETDQSFDGETSITFSSTIDSLDELTLDAETFDVCQVAGNRGAVLGFSQNNGRLLITLDRALAMGETTTLTITYSASNVDVDSAQFGLDGDYPLGFTFGPKTSSNPQMIYSLNWPEGARHWFPSFDHPSDWATHETIVTVRNAYRVVANGSLVSDALGPQPGQRTVHWRQDKPQPTYLYVMVAGPHSVLEDSYGDLPLHYWVYPGDEADARTSFRQTPQMIGFFEDLYGTRFPWDKYDQIIIPRFGGGAESTSATVLGSGLVKNESELKDHASNPVISHEVAHQWWGDMIGYRDWTHAWLSESFATHGDYLFTRYDLGPDEGAYYLNGYKLGYLHQARNRFMRPVVTNKWNKPRDMFDAHTYDKGGVILNMFRDLVGEDTFGEILQDFLKTHGYSNVISSDFFDTVKRVTQEDYSWFFEQWLLRPGHPVLEVSKTWDDDAKMLSLTIKQTQDTSGDIPLYRLPVRIGITTSLGRKTERIWLDQKQQSYTFVVVEEPLLVHFDEGDILLKEWTFDKATRELLYQLSQDQVMGRLWAVDELAKRLGERNVRSALKEAAFGDDFWAVRERALQVLGPVQDDAFISRLTSLASDDPHSHVRAAALKVLGQFEDNSLAGFLRERSQIDESGLVRDAAIAAID
jgi:aminopeptidase N